ncbi:MAG: hypothetical protein ACI8UP_001864 [Porticoccaceae bacterium]|jgi:hypothetical protein
MHHTLAHEGGYSIQPVASSKDRINEQFSIQPHADNTGIFNVAKELRNDRESLNTVRKLSQTKYRFHVVNADGQNINSRLPKTNSESLSNDKRNVQAGSNADRPFISKPLHPFGFNHIHSARVECAEQRPRFL